MNVYTSTVGKADLRLGDILCDEMDLGNGKMLSFDYIVKLELEGEDTVINGTITLHGQSFTVIRREDHSYLYDALKGVL